MRLCNLVMITMYLYITKEKPFYRANLLYTHDYTLSIGHLHVRGVILYNNQYDLTD